MGSDPRPSSALGPNATRDLLGPTPIRYRWLKHIFELPLCHVKTSFHPFMGA